MTAATLFSGQEVECLSLITPNDTSSQFRYASYNDLKV